MAEIKVKKKKEIKESWIFEVEVVGGDSSTRHEVIVTADYYQKLTAGQKAPLMPEKLVEKSFEFLLTRESKESILREFSLEVISKYFPEYERQVKEWHV